MKKDVECPYCGQWQEINHDDGVGYSENYFHEQDCRDCGKTYTYQTTVVFYYDAFKADCLNDSEHVMRRTRTHPVQFTMMKCINCEYTRKPTEEEMYEILKGYG